MSEWDSSSHTPSLEKVYEIILHRDARLRHDQFKSSNTSFEEIRTYHSSQCICDLGTKEPTLCSFRSCGICSIIKSCFKTFAFGLSCNNGRLVLNDFLFVWEDLSPNRGRFGEGIYSYRNPALTDRHATSCTTSPYRVLIACDACVEPNTTNVSP